MALLPNRNLFDGTKSPKPTTAEMKTAWATMRDYLAALLGTDSDDKPGARAALGVSSVEDVQAGKSIFAVATGTGDAMVVALTPTLLELVDGMELHVRCPGANGAAAPTLKVDALDPLPIVSGDGSPLVVGAYVANWPAIFRYRKPISAAPAVFELLNPAPVVAGAASSVRQTVLAGAVDANGYASMLSAGSGLSLALVAAATPMVLSFAGGYDATGEVNYLTRLTTNVASVISGLAASNVSYILADYVSATAVTWGKTLAPPQYGRVYNQSAQALLHFNGTAGATTFLDDFGNTWSAQGGAKLQANQSKFGAAGLGGSGTNNVLNGSSDFARCTGITSLGSGSWAIRCWIYLTTATALGVFGGANAASGGTGFCLDISGQKTRLFISSGSGSFDIASDVLGASTMSLNAWHFVELTFDAVAGKYFVYVDGVLDTTIASSLRCMPFSDGLTVGARRIGTVSYFTGYIDEFEVLPYCEHPNGNTYAVPMAAPNIAAAGYASDFFNVSEMKMYRVTGPSAAAGSGPVLTATKRLYVGEVMAGSASVVSVVNYALNGRYLSSAASPVAFSSLGTYTFNHNIGVPVELVSTTGFARRTASDPWFENTLAASSNSNNPPWPATSGFSRNTALVNTGGSGLYIGAGLLAGAGQLLLSAKRAF
ncbi:hypothetical protein ABIC71_000905 [Herbaspirillum seropedicae]|uniref:LamG-like jellyroll fold domain-containing protein n=1 Tax=Herbaspirillum seropedicae TaxID=964 RepID=UPI00339317F2